MKAVYGIESIPGTIYGIKMYYEAKTGIVGHGGGGGVPSGIPWV